MLMESNPKKIPLFLGIFVVALLVFLAYFFFSGKNGNDFSVTEIRGCVDVNRSAYGISSAIFEELPFPPKCFVSVAKAFSDGTFSDEFFFTSQYYLQPEFYPNFKSDGLQFWQNPTSTHYGAVGYGTFPFAKEVYIGKSQTKKVRVFFHSGYGVRTIQGLRLKAVFEIPSDAEWVEIKLGEKSENGFLIGPTFPKFSRNWAKPIDITITAKDVFLNRSIRVFFKTAPPLTNLQEEIVRTPYAYQNATDYVGEQTAFQLSINIQG